MLLLFSFVVSCLLSSEAKASCLRESLINVAKGPAATVAANGRKSCCHGKREWAVTACPRGKLYGGSKGREMVKNYFSVATIHGTRAIKYLTRTFSFGVLSSAARKRKRTQTIYNVFRVYIGTPNKIIYRL